MTIVPTKHDHIVSYSSLVSTASPTCSLLTPSSRKLNSRMAFFTSPEQEVYELRLKRSPSLTSVRTRSRHPSGAPNAPPPSRIHTQSRLLPTLTSDDVSAPLISSAIPSPIPSPVPATSPKLNEPDHGTQTNLCVFDPPLTHRLCLATKDSKSSPKLPRGSVPRSPHRDDSRPPQVPPSVHDPELGPRRRHLDTSSSPSALPSHSRGDFDSGSLSDSGVTSRIPRSPCRSNLSAPSPHNVHLSPLMARHHSPSSPNLPIAGYFSDGDRSPSLLHPSRLDVKRLLSKPAAPSVNSTLSITSGSEFNALPRAQPNSNEAWPSKTKMQVHFQPSSTPPTESTELPPTSPPPLVQPRQRNLLRKRSGSKQTRASVSATLPGMTTTSSALQPTTRSPAAASSRSEFSPTTLQFVIASRSAVPASAPPRGSSSKLTPAGAIALAYKEQDLRREALAAAACAENLSTVVPASGSRLGVPDTPTSDASVASTVGNGKPYCTVTGSSPDCIVIVGSVEDKSYDVGDYSPEVPSPGSHSASASVSAGQPIRSLTRKVSARFRRGRPAVSGASGTQSAYGDGGDGDVPMSGDPSSRHERLRSASYPKIKGKLDSLRLSLDQRNVVVPSVGLDESLDGHSHRPMPTESTPDVVGPSPAHTKGKQKLQEDDTGAGGRLWRLVKRISAGGLRERFHTTGAPVPPVPAIPPDLVPSRTTLEVKMPITPNSASGSGGAEPGGGGPTFGYSMDPHPSTSAVWPNTDGRPSMTCGTPLGTPTTPQGPGTISQPRLPSISSSSPHASEPKSTHFFRSHSSRSSFSSIFCSSPPPPPVLALTQSPSPRTRSRTKSSSSSPAQGPSYDESPQASSVRTRKRSSPDIPSFSVSAVVNNFIVRRPSLVRHQQQQPQNASARSITTPYTEETSAPPPRPARSELRNVVGRDEPVHPLLSPGPSVQSHA